ncbi:unnamed protein product [Rotaria sordida]|nr:unnamed protein product [Rotaria sordida]
MYEKQNSFDQVLLNEQNFGYVPFECGMISYSELSNSYDEIFGVDLTIHHFFSCSKLKFDVNDNFIIKDTKKKDRFDTTVIKSREKLQDDRTVLIFFDTKQLLEEFYQFYSIDLGVISFCITQNKIIDDKGVREYKDDILEKLIKDEYAEQYGHVTLLTKEFGRDVDFQADAKVNDKDDIDVIQTFFSIGTVRKDESGSYELILCLEHLKGNNEQKLKSVMKGMTYMELDIQRRETESSSCLDKMKTIEKKTLSFYQEAIRECNNTNRKDFIEKIKKLQTLSASS